MTVDQLFQGGSSGSPFLILHDDLGTEHCAVGEIEPCGCWRHSSVKLAAEEGSGGRQGCIAVRASQASSASR